MKKQGCNLPSFEEISDHIDGAVDRGHRDGSIKDELRRNFKKYVVDDPKVAGMLERYKDYGKKLLVITNSDYLYTKDLLNYALNPHLKHHKTWEELFDVVITLSDKPRFFEGPQRFFKIENDQGLMSNYEGPVDRGIFQGGWFGKLQEDLGVPGNQILYLGDHIYGDVVSIKKRCAWRTALVLEDLEEELQGLERSRPIQSEINVLMAQKEELEDQLNLLDVKKYPAIRWISCTIK
jgi:HAD superfamily 5'-nucleotidase-like hydrolase